MMITVKFDIKASDKKIQKINAGRKKSEQTEETVEMIEFKENSKWIGVRIDLGEASKFKKK